MKNKILNYVVISFLCLIIFAGCSVVPSSTPDITPTPIEPTPTPYDVIDITVGFYDGSYIVRNLLMDALLESVSLKATFINISDVSDKTGIDMFIPRLTISTEADNRDHTDDYVRYYNNVGKQYGCIDWRDYLGSMPNYLSRFRDKDDFYAHFYLNMAGEYHFSYENSYDGKIYVLPQILEHTGAMHPVWTYNKAWFNKYNYDIPENMEELVDLLIAHKKDYPDSTPILPPQVIGYNNSAYTGVYPTLEDGIAAAYGVDLSFYKDYITGAEIKLSTNSLADILKYENGKMELNSLNKNYVKALDMIKKVQDNALVDAPSYSNVTQSITNTDDFAVTYYYNYSPYERYYPEGFMLDDNWCVFENQLTMTDSINVNTISGYNRVMANRPIAFLVKDQSDALGEEIERRLVEFVDWCASDKGILTLNYGIEGDHYTLDENGKIDDIKHKLSDTFDVTVSNPTIYDKYWVSEINQFLKEPSEEYKVLVKIEKALEGKNVNLMINPNSNLFRESYIIEKQIDEMTVKILEKQIAFYRDYMSGAKTADDYTAYVAELEGLGLNDFLAQIEGIYERAYESGKFIPDSLK